MEEAWYMKISYVGEQNSKKYSCEDRRRGYGCVKSSKFEIDETIYDVEIEGINICLPF